MVARMIVLAIGTPLVIEEIPAMVNCWRSSVSDRFGGRSLKLYALEVQWATVLGL
jgi:hypothetical protein